MKTLLTEFRADRWRAADWTFSDDTKIHLRRRASGDTLRLRQYRDLYNRQAYSTDADLYLETRLFQPTGARGWGIVEVDADQFTDEKNVEVTSMQYRVSDGTDHYYWDGAAWSVAGAGDWNTLAELNGNLTTFWTTARRTIAIVLNLVTTDWRFTPVVRHIQLSYDCEFVTMDEEVVYEGIVGNIEDNMRPAADFPFVGAGTNPETLPAAEAPFEITDVIAAWDHTADPNHDVDLFSSYNPANREITLTGAIPAGNELWARFLYKPWVVVRAHSDIEELERVPAIIVSDIRFPRSARILPASTIMDRSTSPPAGIIWPGQRSALFEMDITLEAPTQTDALRLQAKFREWADLNPRLHLPTIDEYVNLKLVEPLTSIGPPNLQDLRVSRAVIQVGEVVLWDRPAVKAGDPLYPGLGYGVEQVEVAADIGDTEESFRI